MTFRDQSTFPRNLNTYVNDAQQRYHKDGFECGTFDCATFACDWVLLATGVDPMAAFRGKYKTQLGAATALRKYGAGTFLKTIEGHFGESVLEHEVRKGDLAYVTVGDCLGVVTLVGTRQRVLFLHDKDVVFLYLKDCDGFFRVE